MVIASLGVRIQNVWSSLAFRVALMLTLSIAPIGVIAVYQTSLLSRTLEEQAESALLASTVKSVAGEQIAIERALGAAKAMLVGRGERWSDGVLCHEAIARSVSEEGGYRFAGFLTSEGLECSDGRVEDMFAAAALPEKPEAFLIAGAADQSTIILGHPIVEPEGSIHWALLATTHALYDRSQVIDGRRPEAIAFLDGEGRVLRGTHEVKALTAMLPQDRELTSQAMQNGMVFAGEAKDGLPRVYSAVPVYEETIYALAVWPPSIAGVSAAGNSISPWLFPILMWLATLVISYLAINRLVVRHVRHLGKQMRRFARNKMVPTGALYQRQPIELREMNEDFRAMAQALVQDEAELENAVHEKTLLLREVHHRVKNNLQLIASIMNMQIRRCSNDETASMLRRLQDRVLGLAAVHRQMYQATALDRVPANEVIEAVLSQIVGGGSSQEPRFVSELEAIPLIPDQAVPLALLTAEAATNAVAHLDTNSSGEKALFVGLHAGEGGRIHFQIRNTVSENLGGERSDEPSSPTNLGDQLISAFTRQLGGSMSCSEVDGEFIFDLTFVRSALNTEVAEEPETEMGSDISMDARKGAGFPHKSAASAST